MAEVPDEIRKNVGRGGEKIAARYLKRRGYWIRETNYRRKWGEIDIVAEKGNSVRFVEVKTISVSDFSREINYRPEELLHASKLRKVARTAALYMEEKGDRREYQLDAVTVILNEATRVARCKLFEQVLEGNL